MQVQLHLHSMLIARGGPFLRALKRQRHTCWRGSTRCTRVSAVVSLQKRSVCHQIIRFLSLSLSSFSSLCLLPLFFLLAAPRTSGGAAAAANDDCRAELLFRLCVPISKPTTRKKHNSAPLKIRLLAQTECLTRLVWPHFG